MSNTGTSISIIERNMPMDRIAPLVEALEMDKKRFMSTVLLACERTPALMDHHVSQHVQWASSAAALGLEPDGVSGQAFPIPFGGKNPKVQLIIGYKGMTTMAGRAGITINSGILLQGDEWDPHLRPGHPFAVKEVFGNRAGRDLIGVWAQAQLPNGSFGKPLLMDLSEVLAVKAKSPGARKKDSPWNDPKVGMQAMAQKTAVRRLQRQLPALITPGRTWSTHAQGTVMDTLHEEVGQHSYVDLDGQVHQGGDIIDATVTPETPSLRPVLMHPNGTEINMGSWAGHEAIVKKLKISKPHTVEAIHKVNADTLKAWMKSDSEEAREAAGALLQAMVLQHPEEAESQP